MHSPSTLILPNTIALTVTFIPYFRAFADLRWYNKRSNHLVVVNNLSILNSKAIVMKLRMVGLRMNYYNNPHTQGTTVPCDYTPFVSPSTMRMRTLQATVKLAHCKFPANFLAASTLKHAFPVPPTIPVRQYITFSFKAFLHDKAC
jgi:hypothetical protein